MKGGVREGKVVVMLYSVKDVKLLISTIFMLIFNQPITTPLKFNTNKPSQLLEVGMTCEVTLGSKTQACYLHSPPLIR